MINNLQNLEIYSTEVSNYLLIHKNGCTQVKSLLKNNYKELNLNQSLPNKKPYWTVLRDPYDRFISGLTYDLLIVYGNIDNIEKFLDIKFLKNSYLFKISPYYRSRGFISHTIPQWTYLFNQPLNFFVDIKDLDAFSNIHFNVVLESKNKTRKEFKGIVENHIKSNDILQQFVESLIAPDYFLYNHIYTQGLLWNWQMGKMF